MARADAGRYRFHPEGRWRQAHGRGCAAAKQAKTLHAIKLNCARRHLTTAGKQTAIQKALQAAPEKSDRQLAKAIGVSHPTVATARKELEQKGELVKFTTSTGLDGKEYPRQVGKPEPAQRPISIKTM
ncbi:MAG: winged helix-turn-helix domain-containing protein [Candidatus Contendobacter sp.]|nr:MAG: winged helix-turn-helix domain-containing protein [Candidatus Contendobacter sp.]